MAIMEVDETVSKTGFRKRIDEESEDVILNMVQVGIYQFPFKSMVRETVSNAVDAVKEKETARLILTGAAQVSDFYIEMEGDRYKNSKFDPSYYDLAWLSPNDTVYIEYQVNTDPAGRDTLSIKDHGVGLGGTRLEKFFLPGASSKRLNKQALGKFGIGNKSPLATGAGSYRLISTYNGHKYVFDIRESKVDPVIPRFNEKGEENPHILLEGTLDMRGNPMKVYYLPTKEKNSVEIQVEIKKHNKDQVYESVRSQLMYFKEDIQFTEVSTNGDRNVDFKAPILFEDSDLILPLNTGFYSKPHFVLNGVCYGLIDFKEMELNPRFGSIGIKVDISSIDVNPSRESVVYSQKTKDTILSQYQKIAEKVEGFVKEELKVTDPVSWIEAANGVLTGSATSGNQVISRLAGLIDKEEINLTLSNPIQDITLHHSLSKTFGKDLKFSTIASEGWGSNTKVKATETDTIGNINFSISYHKNSKGDAVKNAYLHTLHKGSLPSYYQISYPTDLCRDAGEKYLSGLLTADELKGAITGGIDIPDGKAKVNAVAELIKSINSVKLLKSSSSYRTYEDVKVPQEFEDAYKADKIASLTSTTQSDDPAVEAAKRIAARKAAGKVVLGVITCRGGSSTVFSSKEFKLTDLPDTIVYGHNADSKNLEVMGKMLYRNNNPTKDTMWDGDVLSVHPDVAIFKAAQNLKSKLKEQTHIDDWGFSMENGKLKVNDHIIPSAYATYVKMYLKSNLGSKYELTNMLSVAAILARIDTKYIKTVKKLFKSKYVSFLDNSTTPVAEITKACVKQILFERISGSLTDEDKSLHFDSVFPKTVAIKPSDINNYMIFDEEDLKTLEELAELTVHYYEDFNNLYNGIGVLRDWDLHPKTAALSKTYTPMILEHNRSRLSQEYLNLF